jgi:hypothetical protein
MYAMTTDAVDPNSPKINSTFGTRIAAASAVPAQTCTTLAAGTTTFIVLL